MDTLNNFQDQQAREVTPAQIKSVLHDWSEEQIPILPKVVDIGEYLGHQTDMYPVSKSEFEALLNFWISCFYWVGLGEFEANDLMPFNDPYSYDMIRTTDAADR